MTMMQEMSVLLRGEALSMLMCYPKEQRRKEPKPSQPRSQPVDSKAIKASKNVEEPCESDPEEATTASKTKTKVKKSAGLSRPRMQSGPLIVPRKERLQPGDPWALLQTGADDSEGEQCYLPKAQKQKPSQCKATKKTKGRPDPEVNVEDSSDLDET